MFRPLAIALAAVLVFPAWAARSNSHAKTQVGKASIYSKKFAGRKMASGARLDPKQDVAASKTLPLGTRARVTNLRNGRSAVVTIEDRGPHVPGRIVDLTPATADKLGISRREGLTRVEVTPIALPPEEPPPVALE